MKILVAPDKFKGSLDAGGVARAIRRGILEALPELEAEAIRLCPLADGGDGTASVLVDSLGGSWLELPTYDPLGRPVVARVGLVRRGGTTAAVVESASASGLALLEPHELDPVRASTFGTGKLVRDCVRLPGTDAPAAESVLVCVGGTATVDAGLGALAALGARLLDRGGRVLGPGDSLLFDTARIEPDWRMLEVLQHDVGFEVATDVTNPLLGPRGAVSAYGPQKGVSAERLATFEEAMRRVCDLYAEVFGVDVSDTPRAGAGGGLAGGLMAATGATPCDGFELVAEAVDLRTRVAEADVVVTGEGAVDRTSFEGKALGKVIDLARTQGKEVVVIAGRVDEEALPTDSTVVFYVALESLATYPGEAHDRAPALVEAAAYSWASGLRRRLGDTETGSR